MERRRDTEQSHFSREIQEVTSLSKDKIDRLEGDLAHAQVERNLLHSNLAATAAVKDRSVDFYWN